MLAEDAGALAGGGAGGDHVVEDGDGGALEGRAAVAEGAGDVLAALAGAQANLAGSRANALEASRGRVPAEAVKENLGLVEAALATAAGVQGDGEDGVGVERLDDRSEGGGHVGREVADAAELEAVDNAAGGALHLEGGAGAVEVAPAEAVGAAALVVAPHATAAAAARTAGGEELVAADLTEVLAEGATGDAARGVEQVEGAGEEGGHGRGG